jgi:hypothetical protein
MNSSEYGGMIYDSDVTPRLDPNPVSRSDKIRDVSGILAAYTFDSSDYPLVGVAAVVAVAAAG